MSDTENFMRAREWAERAGKLEGLLHALVHSLDADDLMHDDQRAAYKAACTAIGYESASAEVREAGACECGAPVTLIRNSEHPTMWRDGRRFIYADKPDDGACIFRCRACGEPIHETWRRAPGA